MSAETTVEFRDEAKLLPKHTEVHDEHKQVQMTGDYEYTFDSHGNWIRRMVYVWTQATGRTLVQVQDRALTYWTN